MLGYFMGSYRLVLVDGSPIGLLGLDAALESFRVAGRQPGEMGLGLELVKYLSQDNYIPISAQTSFAAALEREFAAFLSRVESGNAQGKDGYGLWRGHLRETIPWFPSVNDELCNGCGVCLKLCSTHCLAPVESGKVWVADPFACVVGCSSCATVCKPKAITFPARSMLDAYRPK